MLFVSLRMASHTCLFSLQMALVSHKFTVTEYTLSLFSGDQRWSLLLKHEDWLTVFFPGECGLCVTWVIDCEHDNILQPLTDFWREGLCYLCVGYLASVPTAISLRIFLMNEQILCIGWTYAWQILLPVMTVDRFFSEYSVVLIFSNYYGITRE